MTCFDLPSLRARVFGSTKVIFAAIPRTDCIAADIDNQYRLIFGNLGNDITHDSVYTRVFQSDGAENCGAGFYHSGRNVSVAGI